MPEPSFHRRVRLAAIVLALSTTGAGATPAPDAQHAGSALDRPAVTTSIGARVMLLAVQQAGKRLVAVGERGHVLLSEDDGKTWQQAKVPVSVTLTALAFADERVGVAVGHAGVILRTEDGGRNWSRVTDGRTIAQQILESVDKTDKNAVTEARRGVEDGPANPLLDVRFADARRGLAVGADGLVLATGDGGASWTPLVGVAPAQDRRHLYAILRTSAEWYLAGEQGALYRSDDDARTFTKLTSPYRGSYFGILGVKGGGVVAFGLRGNAYLSSDRGATWGRVNLPSQATLLGGLSLSDGSLLLFDEVGHVWRSREGAGHFEAADAGSGLPIVMAVQTGADRFVTVGPRGISQLTLNPSR